MSDITETVDGKVLIIESETAGLVDGRQGAKAVHFVGQEHPASDSRHGQASTLLRTVMITRSDGALLSSREIVCLSANHNDHSKKVKYDGGFLEELDNIIQYSRTWEEQYGMSYAEERIVDIRTDIISANFLEGERKESANLSKVIRYVRISNLMRQKPDVYDHLKRLDKTVYSENDRSNTIGPTHLECPLLFQMDVTECRLYLQSADRNLQNKKVKGAFEPKQFFMEASLLYRALDSVQKAVHEQGGEMKTMVKIQTTPSPLLDHRKQSLSGCCA